MLLKRKKIVKTVNLKVWKFSFSVHFSKISSRRQAKLITIYRIPRFSFFISFRFQCNTCFKYAISCFAKACRNNFASIFFTSCSLWYPCVKKLHRVPYLAFGTNFFPKITTAKTPTTADRQLRHAHTETSKVAISSY